MKKIVALAIVVVVVAAGYTVAWLWAAGQAGDYVKRLETADGIDTPRLVCASFGIGGFPFGFDATCTEATIQTGDVTIEVSGLKASVEVYRPTHALVFAQGPATIEDAFTGSRSRLDFNAARGSARLDGWRIARVSTVLEEPLWTDTLFGDRLLARADQLELHLIDAPEKHDAAAGLATVAVYAKAEGLDAPGPGIAAGEATFEAEITNLPDDVRSYGDADLLRRWQAAGGRLEQARFKGDAADLALEASGTLGLDGAGRVEGQLQLRSSGVVERLGPLLPEQYRGLIVGAQDADGSYSQALTFTGGVVFSGLVPAGMVPPLF